MKNPHKFEPDTFYYCAGAGVTGNHTGTTWDPDPDNAKIFYSMESTAACLQKLKADDVEDLKVLRRIITYEPANIEHFIEIVTKNKIREIIDTLDDDDVDFLVKHANLDLTIVT